MKGGRRLAWLGHKPSNYEGNDKGNIDVSGDSSAQWSSFKDWISKKYSKVYVQMICYYVRKHYYLLNGNLRELDSIESKYVRNNVVKCLIVLSKFLNRHEEFKNRLKAYDIKLYTQDSFASFLRIFNNHSSDLLGWHRQASAILRDNEKLFLKYALFTGLRRTEAITSFNLIIKLARENRLHEYYDEQIQCVQHFRYRELFLRRTKNAFISFASKDLITQISSSEPLTFPAIRKRLNRHNLKCRINECRDYFGTYMTSNGLSVMEQDLLCGRLNRSIFTQCYWSPSFKELRGRVAKALAQLEQML